MMKVVLLMNVFQQGKIEILAVFEIIMRIEREEGKLNNLSKLYGSLFSFKIL